MNLKIDPEFKALIHALSDEEREQLESNLKADGCLDPIKAWDELIVDGHNRYDICQEHGIEFRVESLEFDSRDAAKIWIIRNQFGRRNLKPFQKAELALLLEPLIAKQAKENLKTAKPGVRGGSPSQNSVEPIEVDDSDDDRVPLSSVMGGNGRKSGKKKSRNAGKRSIDTQKELAKVAGVSHDTIHKAKVISEKAPEAVKQKLRDGDLSINQVYTDLKRKEKKEEKSAAKSAVPSDLPAITDRYELIVGDVAKITNDQVKSNSVDWIISDPPYSREFLCVYNSLSVFAARALKPGGSLLAMVGQSYLPEITQRLSGSLTYHWELAYLTPGGQAVQLWDRKVNTFWKPLLWFVKGKYAGDWIGDVCQSKVNDNDKEHHHWGQSESGMADIIGRFTYPGQTICDPFLGGGTTGVVAVKMNRRFIGIDIDAAAVETTKRRLTETESGLFAPRVAA